MCVYVPACLPACLPTMPPDRLLPGLQDQNTPLHLAAKTGCAPVCAELVRYGAGANAKNAVSLSICSHTHAHTHACARTHASMCMCVHTHMVTQRRGCERC